MTEVRDDRKSEKTTVSEDKTPRIAPEPVAEGVVAPVATKGDEATANSGSTEDKLASAVKSQGVDLVRVWHDEGRELYYVEMNKDGIKRLLSVTEDAAKKPTDAAKDVVATAGF